MVTHGIEERNENVESSMDLLEINNLVIKANKGTIHVFPHKPIHKITWTSERPK